MAEKETTGSDYVPSKVPPTAKPKTVVLPERKTVRKGQYTEDV